MVKKTSYVFVLLLSTIIIMIFSTILLPSSSALIRAINYNALALLICGIVLIVALIKDRYRDHINETKNNDYKKY